jgi:hypothetical protein
MKAMRPPAIMRFLILAASYMLPRGSRSEWRERRCAELRDWWLLDQRGELGRADRAWMLAHCLGGFAETFWLHFSRDRLRAFVRGPVFPLAGCLTALVLMAGLTGGFSHARALVDAALIGHGFGTAFALVAGLVLISCGYRPFGRHGWRFWLFLGTKTMLALATVELSWIEVVGLIRDQNALPQIRPLGALVLTLAFIPLFGYVAKWSFMDQRNRCPVCLHLLAMPVTIGSWSSVLEPTTTELVCERGHGALSVPETEAGEDDRWTKLDSSWGELFEAESRQVVR